jgi:hypothetical protein
MDDTVEGLVKRLRARTFSKWSSDIQAVEDFEDELASEAASAIEALVVERDERQPHFEGVAKHKLDDLLTRGWAISGYSITKDGEYGLVTTGGFVGWWTVASNNADAAEARALAAEAQRDKLAEAVERIIDANDDYLMHNPTGEPDALTTACAAARSTLDEIAP